MTKGSQPTDGGNLLLSADEYINLTEQEVLSKKYLRPFTGAQEYLNGTERWCLWFYDVDTVQLNKDLMSMPLVSERINNVKNLRLKSTSASTRKFADKPHLFQSIRQPKNGNYLVIPRHTSENRRIIPIGFLSSNVICGDAANALVNATLYHFGLLSSNMHNAFMRLTAGRLESRYRYSNTIVYNNFPYPFDANDEDNKTLKDKEAIILAAQAVLDARKLYQDVSEDSPSLAKLYNTYMIDPYPELTKAHAALDKTVDKAYGYKGKGDDASRVEFLLKRIAEACE